MKIFTIIAIVAGVTSTTLASPATDDKNHQPSTSSFGGVSSYFLHAFQENNRTDVLDAIQAAGGRVLRIFISYTPSNNKGTGSIEMQDIEPMKVGTFDDFQLEAIDRLMFEAEPRGIKLIIAMHDRYQLGCWGNDTYVPKYHLPAINCAVESVNLNNVTSWYMNPSAIHDYENRIAHILNHGNGLLGGRAWKDLSSHIFSFNIQNEGEGHLNNQIAPVPEWWCDRSRFMRRIMGASGILISTGGGDDWTNSDIPENWACPTLDLIGLHSYDGPQSFATKGPIALQHAIAANKLVMVEEFGASGPNKSSIVQEHIDIFNKQLKMPWAIWEISKPGMGTGDFEFWIDEPTYGVVASGGRAAMKMKAVQAWRNLNLPRIW